MITDSSKYMGKILKNFDHTRIWYLNSSLNNYVQDNLVPPSLIMLENISLQATIYIKWFQI